MKRIRSYSSIWAVEKVIYAISDFKLPFPVTISQMTWFILSLFFVIFLGDIPPLSLIQEDLLRYLGLPIGVTFIMSRKTFDGKKPYGFLKSVVSFLLRPKITYTGKPVKQRKKRVNIEITAVRRMVCERISN